MMMLFAHRRRMNEDSSDSDDSTIEGDEEEELADAADVDNHNLPQYFCGRLIQRQLDDSSPHRSIAMATSTSQNLHIDTSIANDTSNASRSGLQSPNNNERNNTRQPPSQSDDTNSSNNNDRPPSPWGSSTSKQRIIDELKDETSDIHLQLGAYTDDNFKEVNFKYLLQHYAGNKYKLSNFRANVIRILKHFINTTGPFKPDENVIENWYTSVNKVSKGYALLYLLWMHQSRRLETMTTEQIWQSNPLFQEYELEKFETYNKNMKKLTEKRRRLIKEEEDAFHHDMLLLPANEITNRGVPFWNKHSASKLLEQDEASGVAKKMKPKQLWQSRIEYKDFPLSVFRKHIYQERTKQLAAPYWQYKRNQIAKKKFEDAQQEMKRWDQNQFEGSLNNVIDEWERLHFEE